MFQRNKPEPDNSRFVALESTVERLSKDVLSLADRIRKLENFKDRHEEFHTAQIRTPKSEALLAELTKYRPNHEFYVITGSGKITYRDPDWHKYTDQWEPEDFERLVVIPAIAEFHRETCKEPKKTVKK